MQLNNYLAQGRVSRFFTCDCCGSSFPDAGIQRRLSMAGQYCHHCASQERCAACGEWCDGHDVTYKPHLQACICSYCEEHYHEVAHLLKKPTSIF